MLVRYSTVLFFVAYCASQSLISYGYEKALEKEDDRTRVYGFKKVNGGGCPYTGSWLAHVNLYRRVTWYLDSQKMEAASWLLFDTSRLKFQVADPDAYFVHHLSMYEHLLHRKVGYDIAQNKTVILSKSAMEGECGSLKIRSSQEYLALIPFFGGRPPNVTANLKVASLGQGNSLVSAETKSQQCMATLCSTLKYYGHAVIGVVRDIDLRIMIDALDQMPQTVRDHTHVVQLKVNKNANLPFHLLSWGQQYVKEYNCGLLSEKNKQKALSRVLSESATGVRSSSGEEEWTDQHDLMQICATNGIARSRGTPVNVVYHRVSLMHSKNDTAVASAIATANAEADAESAAEEPMVDENGKETKSLPRPRKQAGSKVPIKFVYYTECDQIVHYDSMNTAEAMSSASNESAFFVGRRKEKSPDTEPADYMGGLNQWRECGDGGFSMQWPKDNIIRMVN